MNDYSWGIAVGIVIIAGTAGRAVAAVLRAYATRIGRGSHTQGDSQLAETVEVLQRRLNELEERVDFAERLLAKQREAERLPPVEG